MTRDYSLVSLDDEGPSAVRRFFFRDASLSETPAEVVSWWEKRRLAFNLAVGSAGMATLSSIYVLNWLGPNPHDVMFPGIGIVVYGVLANVFYTGGWISELLLRPVFGRKTPVVGATIFRYGLAFSVGLTMLPIVVASADFGIRVLKWIFGGGG